MDTIRLFFAVEIGDTAQGKIDRIVQEVRASLPPGDERDARWTRSNNLHITLKFLGETPSGALPALVDAAARAVSGYTPTDCRIGGCGVFGNRKRRSRKGAPPRAIRAEVNDEGFLSLLAGSLDAALETLGYEREQRQYVPHVTLARVRADHVVDRILGRLEAHPMDISFTASEVTLFRSELYREGPIYTPLSRLSLGEVRK